jgi:regulator of RNase E activity RraA
VPGRINWPVSVGGVTVQAGDLVVADADGVVVVEPAKVPAVLEQAKQKLADETARLEGIRNGDQLRPKWLDGALRKAGVLAEGETL